MVKEYQKIYEEQVIDLILPIQQLEYEIPITIENQPDLKKIETFYQKGKGNFWVALCDNKVVGTIGLLDIGDQMVALRKMFVHQNFRGLQYKTAANLLHQAINWAKDLSLAAIYLGTTPQFLAAHRFYEKNGFIPVMEIDLPTNFPVMQVDKLFYKYNL